MKQAENKSDALWKRMAKLREEVQLGPTALEEMRKSGKNSVKFLDVYSKITPPIYHSMKSSHVK